MIGMFVSILIYKKFAEPVPLLPPAQLKPLSSLPCAVRLTLFRTYAPLTSDVAFGSGQPSRAIVVRTMFYTKAGSHDIKSCLNPYDVAEAREQGFKNLAERLWHVVTRAVTHQSRENTSGVSVRPGQLCILIFG